MVLARFGPRLPALVEAALMRQSNEPPVEHRSFWRWMALAGVTGMAAGSALILVLDWLN